MIHLLQPFTHAILFAVDELADRVERRRGEMAQLCFVGKIVGIELADKFSESLCHFFRMLVAVSWILPLGPGE